MARNHSASRMDTLRGVVVLPVSECFRGSCKVYIIRKTVARHLKFLMKFVSLSSLKIINLQSLYFSPQCADVGILALDDLILLL